MRCRLILAAGLLLPASLLAGAASAAVALLETVPAVFSPGRLALIDRPYQGENIALAPNGVLLAHTRYEDRKLWLVVSDLAARRQRVAVIQDDAGRNEHHPRLAELRWASDERLILVGLDGEIMSFDAITGQRPVMLWEKGNAGLSNDSNLRKEPYFITAGTPRLLPALPGDPGHVMIESVAEIGPDRLVNVFRINVATGATELPDEKWYRAWQVALYGRGDLLIWAPLPADVLRWVRNPTLPGGTDGSLRSVQAYFDSTSWAAAASAAGQTPFHTRSKLEMFLSFPPEPGPDGGIDLRGWPASPNPSGPLPPAAFPLSPETGAAVTPESSSTGRMIYDRQGRPRLLYTQGAGGGVRRWYHFETGRPVFEPNQKPRDLADALGEPKGREFELSAENYFGERSYPLAFDFDPDVLYIASNVGRDTFGIYQLNLRTRERTAVVTPEDLRFDLAPLEPDYSAINLVFDEKARRLVGVRYNSLHPTTLWIDPELAALQASLDDSFRFHTVEILGWDLDRQRFLFRNTSAEDPGAYFIHHRADESAQLVLLRAPWLAGTTLHASSPFAFETPAGVRLTGYLTLPANPKVTPPPLLIYCRGGLWDDSPPGFSREAQMLADLGIAVMRVNYRGTAGQGRAHLTALREGIDTVPLEDVMSALEWISGRYAIDRSRIVIMGEGFGGYLALRAIQLHHQTFRAAISLNAPTNLNSWASWKPLVSARPVYRTGGNESTSTVDFHSQVRGTLVKTARKAAPTPPVDASDRKQMLVIESYDSRETTPILSLLAATLGLGARGAEVEKLGVDGPFENGSLETRTRILRRIEEFLNFNLYEYGASMGPLRVVEDPPAAK